MKISERHGFALVVYGNEITTMEFEKGRHDNYPVFLLDEEELDVREYDKHADVYYHGSDDGGRYYELVHVLATASDKASLPDASSFPLPSSFDLVPSGVEAVASVVASVMKNRTDPHNLTYALKLVSNFECIYGDYLEMNDLGLAQKRIIARVFGEEV